MTKTIVIFFQVIVLIFSQHPNEKHEILNLTNENFTEVINKTNLIIVQFYARNLLLQKIQLS